MPGIMSHHWLLIAFSWFTPVSLQYIDTRALAVEAPLDIADTNLQYPLPHTQYFSQPPNFESFENEAQGGFQREVDEPLRKRRTIGEKDMKAWPPNPTDIDKTVYLKNDDSDAPTVFGYHDDDNNTEVEKRSFSPWGGKRDRPPATLEHMWSWKRSSGIREPSMPKRVRFSPWGGKRSGQMIFKPGSKGSKIIFFSSIPELMRIVSNYSPSGKRLSLAGFQFIPGMDKRHPIKILAMSSSMDEKMMREGLPFNTFIEPPKVYKPGHPYNEVHLKKDGKRKMKFSIWGGKRSPPIIGPIWTPASRNIQEYSMNDILLLRNKQNNEVNAL